MYEKLDDFFEEYMKIVHNGKEAVAEFILKGFYATIGIFVMIIAFPLWLIGRLNTKQ